MAFSSNYSRFILMAYSDPIRLRWLYFCIMILLYLIALVSNVLLITVIVQNRNLHQPMYLFLCSLFINEIHISFSIFPFLMLEMQKDQHTISRTFCFMQIFSVYSYANIEVLTLAAMSYDRFLAICLPLQYHHRMTPQKALRIVYAIWLFVILEVSFMVSLSAPLRLCGNQIPKAYCDNYSVVKLACGNIMINNVYGLVYTCIILLSIPAIIIYTYARIITVSIRGSHGTRHKALTTCGPHLASMVNLAFASFFEIIQSRFDMSHLDIHVRVFLSLYFLMCPPLFHPLIYGLNLKSVRTGLWSLLQHRPNTGV